MNQYVLYQFGVSHYCEKIRWALDYKKLPYRSVNLLPGQHIAVVRKLTGNRSTQVPVLQAGSEVVTGSSEIISWLDKHHLEQPLTPAKDLTTQVLEWEAFTDEHIGDHVRRICYFTLLSHRDILLPMFAHKGPWYGKTLLKLMYSRLANLMRKSMKIDEANTAASLAKLKTVLQQLAAQRGDSVYLINDEFTRADLAAAALFAPLCATANYGHPMPAEFPEPLAGVIQEFAADLQWVHTLYQRHR